MADDRRLEFEGRGEPELENISEPVAAMQASCRR
jgi:hypothetical protein